MLSLRHIYSGSRQTLDPNFGMIALHLIILTTRFRNLTNSSLCPLPSRDSKVPYAQSPPTDSRDGKTLLDRQESFQNIHGHYIRQLNPGVNISVTIYGANNSKEIISDCMDGGLNY
jgi:hypothetical protein